MTETQMKRLADLIANRIFEVAKEKQEAEDLMPRFYAEDDTGIRQEITEQKFIEYQIEDLQQDEREYVKNEKYNEALEIQRKIEILKTKLNKLL
jgi:hypothetical protein